MSLHRRKFIAALGGAAAWPLAARAQRSDRVRRIGLLMGFDENDPLAKPWVSAFTQALAGLGWSDGRNMRMAPRWGRADINRMRALAQELVGLQPDIILASGTPSPAASSRGSTVRAGTSPASPPTKPRWEVSGLSCFRRSLPA